MRLEKGVNDYLHIKSPYKKKFNTFDTFDTPKNYNSTLNPLKYEELEKYLIIY